MAALLIEALIRSQAAELSLCIAGDLRSVNDANRTRPTVFIVDRDASSVAFYAEVLNAAGFDISYFPTPAEFIARLPVARPCCVVAEYLDSEQGGEAFQLELLSGGQKLPLIMHGNCREVTTAVRLMERGALTIIAKPSSAETLLRYVRQAIEADTYLQQTEMRRIEVGQAIEKLTERQRRVLDFVVAGLPTKRIASELSVSQRLIEMERTEILRLFAAITTPNVMLKIGEYRVLHEMQLRLDRQTDSLLAEPHLSSIAKSPISQSSDQLGDDQSDAPA